MLLDVIRKMLNINFLGKVPSKEAISWNLKSIMYLTSFNNQGRNCNVQAIFNVKTAEAKFSPSYITGTY